MEEKVYTPQVITENPFPSDVTNTQAQSTGSTPTGTYTPTTASEKPFPKKKVATELLADSLNTRSRNILQEFELQQSGGFKVGNFQEGVTGDIRLTPNGLVARDIAGNTTIAVDGLTGDVSLKGTIRASRFENDNFTVDEEGNVIANSIQVTSNQVVSSSAGLNQVIISGETDITNASISLVLERDTTVLILADVSGYGIQSPDVGTDYYVRGIIRIKIDGTEKSRDFIWTRRTSSILYGLSDISNVSPHVVESLSAGTHIIKLTGENADATSNGALNIYKYNFSLVTLGNT